MKNDVVRTGYNKIAKDYQEWRQGFSNFSQFQQFSRLLPQNAKVLDIGCGTGIPVAQFLAEEGYSVTGIDISPEMIKLARKNVPKGQFFRMDMMKMNFGKDVFDGIIAAYSLIHIPREKHEALIKEIAMVLKAGGIFTFSVGRTGKEFYSEFLGAKMFWSYYSPKKYLGLLRKSGFKIVSSYILEGDGVYPDYWVLAKK